MLYTMKMKGKQERKSNENEVMISHFIEMYMLISNPNPDTNAERQNR